MRTVTDGIKRGQIDRDLYIRRRGARGQRRTIEKCPDERGITSQYSILNACLRPSSNGSSGLASKNILKGARFDDGGHIEAVASPFNGRIFSFWSSKDRAKPAVSGRGSGAGRRGGRWPSSRSAAPSAASE